IALPAARTPIQKLEMRGENINVSNIEKASRASGQETPRNGWQAFFDTIGRVLTGIFKAAVKVIAFIGGIFLILMGASLVIFFILLNTGIGNGIHPIDFTFSIPMMFHYTVLQGGWLYQLVNLLVFILPVLAIIYLGLKLLFSWQFNDRKIWLSVLLLWIVGLVLWIVLAIVAIKNIKSENVVEEKMQFMSLIGRTLVLEAKEPWVQNTTSKHGLKINDRALYYINPKNEIIGKSELIIERAQGNEVEVVLEKNARGKDELEAAAWAQKISVHLSQVDSILYIPAFFTLHDRKEWHAQQLKVTVKVPAGQTLFISPKLKDILVDADLNETRWISELPGNTWKMTSNGLQQVNPLP
ncbi:MAG: hypothetical protein ACP5PS_03455, partial [Bacteroidales bacterium]